MQLKTIALPVIFIFSKDPGFHRSFQFSLEHNICLHKSKCRKGLDSPLTRNLMQNGG